MIIGIRNGMYDFFNVEFVSLYFSEYLILMIDLIMK